MTAPQIEDCQEPHLRWRDASIGEPRFPGAPAGAARSRGIESTLGLLAAWTYFVRDRDQTWPKRILRGSVSLGKARA